MGAAGAGTQPIARPLPAPLEQLDTRLRIRLVETLHRRELPVPLDDPRPHHLRKLQLRPITGDRLVHLADLLPLEQLLIGAPPRRIGRAQQHPGGHPVEPMHRHQLRQLQLAAQPHHHRLADVRTARDGRQEVRFVHHHQPGLAVQHPHRERHRHLRRRLPIEVHEPGRLTAGVRLDPAPVLVDQLPRRQAGEPVLLRMRRLQELDDRAGRDVGGHPDPVRAEPVAHRQRGTAHPQASTGSGTHRSHTKVSSRPRTSG